MSGPMYDFFMCYIFLCIFLTLFSIKEVRSEVAHICYVITLFIVKIITSIFKYLTDCFCRKKFSREIDISNPISDVKNNSDSEFELQTQYGFTRYAIL